jgi:hypothetical protein
VPRFSDRHQKTTYWQLATKRDAARLELVWQVVEMGEVDWDARAAKALGLSVRESFLLLADEVIE